MLWITASRIMKIHRFVNIILAENERISKYFLRVYRCFVESLRLRAAI